MSVRESVGDSAGNKLFIEALLPSQPPAPPPSFSVFHWDCMRQSFMCCVAGSAGKVNQPSVVGVQQRLSDRRSQGSQRMAYLLEVFSIAVHLVDGTRWFFTDI